MVSWGDMACSHCFVCFEFVLNHARIWSRLFPGRRTLDGPSFFTFLFFRTRDVIVFGIRRPEWPKLEPKYRDQMLEAVWEPLLEQRGGTMLEPSTLLSMTPEILWHWGL